jgi:hypothetical protein
MLASGVPMLAGFGERSWLVRERKRMEMQRHGRGGIMIEQCAGSTGVR